MSLLSPSSAPLCDQLTVADLSVWDTIDLLVSEKPDILGLYPKLLEHRAKIKTLPKLKKYLETRPPDQEVPKNPKATTMPQGSPQNAQYQGVGSSTKWARVKLTF